jgi:hypothetical protein
MAFGGLAILAVTIFVLLAIVIGAIAALRAVL